MNLPPLADYPFQSHQLSNGLRVVLQEDRALPLVAINLWYHVGSKNEVPGRTGLAHLFEHMLFQGSRNVAANQHFAYIQQVGGVANGSTWYDRTNYYETLPSHALDLGLWLESDRMGFLLDALTDENLETQRQVVLNERRQRVDNPPYGRAMERLFELLYASGHPYRWPVIGYAADIAAARREEVAAFFETYYAPANAVLTLCGDFDSALAHERVEHWFGTLPARNTPAPAVGPPVSTNAANGPSNDVLHDRVALERVYLAWSLPPFGTRDWFATSMLATARAGGKSAPVIQDLVHRRRLAQDVGLYAYPTELAGTLVAVATARPGESLDAIEATLIDAVEGAALAPPASEDWDFARRRHLVDAFGGLETVGHRADLISRSLTFFDDPGAWRTELEAYATLGPDDAAAAARRWFVPERRVSLRVVPDRSGASS